MEGRFRMLKLKISLDEDTKTVKLSREIFKEESVGKYNGKRARELFPTGYIAGVPMHDVLKDFDSYVLEFVPGASIDNGNDEEGY